MKPPKSCALKQHNKADRYTANNMDLPKRTSKSITAEFGENKWHTSAVCCCTFPWLSSQKSANKWRKIQNSHEYFMCTCPWRLCTRRQTGNVTEDDANDDGLYVRVERQMSRSWPHHCQHDSLHVAVSSRPHELSLSLTHSPRLSTCTLHVPRQSLTISFDNRVDLVVSGR